MSTCKEDDCCLRCWLSTSFILLYMCLFLLPGSEIFMGFYFANDITCTTTLFISLSNWLVIKGFVSIFSIICTIPIVFSGKNSLCNSFFMFVLYIVNVFTVAWLIVGSIIFWRDCINTAPYVLNVYMWVSLILGYIVVVNLGNEKYYDLKN